MQMDHIFSDFNIFHYLINKNRDYVGLKYGYIDYFLIHIEEWNGSAPFQGSVLCLRHLINVLENFTHTIEEKIWSKYSSNHPQYTNLTNQYIAYVSRKVL